MHAYPLPFWKTLLPYLTHWRALDVDQRAAALTLRPSYQSLSPLLAALPPDMLEVLFEADAKGRHRPLPGFQAALRFLERLAGWSFPDRIDVTLFIQQNTTLPQRAALSGISLRSPSAMLTAGLEGRLLDGWFAKLLLASQSAGAFLAGCSGWKPEATGFAEPQFQALQRWLRRLMEKGWDSFSLQAENVRAQEASLAPEELIHLAVNYGLAVVALMPSTLEPVMQILAPKETIEQGPGNLALGKTEVAEAGDGFARPYLLDDMEIYLRSLKAEPAPLLSDGYGVPVAHHRKVAKRFPVLPGPLPRFGFADEDRARAAWWLIARMDLILPQGRGHKNRKVGIHPRGEAWLALSRQLKLDAILAEAPCGQRTVHDIDDRFNWLGDFETIAFPYAALSARVFAWMDLALAGLGEGGEGLVDLDAWLESAARGCNPFLADCERDADLAARWGRWEEAPQSVYPRLLEHYLGRLSSLGAVAFSAGARGNLGVSLTPIGRYLMGVSDAWTLPETGRPVAMVGADFGIMFLEPSPALAMELGAFAEAEAVAGAGGAGLAFRLTRASVQAAAHQGWAAAEMIRILKACAKKGVPANVVHEIEAWTRSKQSVRVRQAVLVEGDDPIVMAEMLSRFPKDFEKVAPTVLKYLGEAKPGALERKLAKKGFFAE